MSEQLILLCLIVMTFFIHSKAFNWNKPETSYLPRATSPMSVAYDRQRNSIWLLYGWPSYRQLISFDIDEQNSSNPFTLNNANALLSEYSANIDECQPYSTNNDMLHSISYDGKFIEQITFSTASPVHFERIRRKLLFDIGGRYSSCLVHIDGYLIITGGSAYTASKKMQIYDMYNDKWIASTPPLIEKRRGHSCAISNSYLYLISGMSSETVETIYIADPENIIMQHWLMLDFKLPSRPRVYGKAVNYGQYIYVIGGMTWKQVDVIDTSTNKVITFGNLLVPAVKPAVIIVDERIYIFGGHFSSVWQYHDIILVSAAVDEDNNTTNAESKPLISEDNRFRLLESIDEELTKNDPFKARRKQQFYEFLVRLELEQYYDNFIEDGFYDIRDVCYFNQEYLFYMLNSMKTKRKSIKIRQFMKQSKKLRTEMTLFRSLILSPILDILHQYCIFTMDMLCNEMENNHDRMIFNITEEEDVLFLSEIIVNHCN